MPRAIKYSPLPHQEAFHRTNKPKTFLSTGLGGGKTYSLVMQMFQLMALNPKVPGGIMAPELKMYKKDVLPAIKEICEENEIPYSYHQGEFLWKFPDTRSDVYVFPADQGKIRGPTLGWGVINEVTLCDEQSFKHFLGRIRHKNARFRQLAMSGTPEEFNWAYEYFVENPREDTNLIFGDARHNLHVHPDYFKDLEASYDEKMREAYILGRFVSLAGGRALWMFNRNAHTDLGQDIIQRVPGAPVWVSCDFNVSPISATLWNRVSPQANANIPALNNKSLLGFDEVKIESSNTYELCDAIKEKVPDWREIEMVIFPDPAGDSRSTRSTVSDIEILSQSGFSDIRYKPSIRSVKSCLQAANNQLEKGQVMLNSKRCPQTVADFEQCIIKPGSSFVIDKSNPKRTHWLDGFKNMMDYEFPVIGRGNHRITRFR